MLEGLCSAQPCRGICIQEASQQVQDDLRYVQPGAPCGLGEVFHRERWPGAEAFHQLLLPQALEGVPPEAQLVGHRAHAPHVPLGAVLPQQHLRGEVLRGAARHRHAGHRGAHAEVDDDKARLRVLRRPRQQHVLRLHIPVNDAVLVYMSQAREHLPGQPQGLWELQRALHLAAPAQLHDHHRRVAVLPGVEHLDHVRVRGQAPTDVDLVPHVRAHLAGRRSSAAAGGAARDHGVPVGSGDHYGTHLGAGRRVYGVDVHLARVAHYHHPGSPAAVGVRDLLREGHAAPAPHQHYAPCKAVLLKRPGAVLVRGVKRELPSEGLRLAVHRSVALGVHDQLLASPDLQEANGAGRVALDPLHRYLLPCPRVHAVLDDALHAAAHDLATDLVAC
mmetsp:Transcript_63496/g.171312  ORF Transcript_63496/g.171312 Transcript_63496/m.171312 type:complete len:390 (-) Transcript_63496:459-1628(-)